MTRHNQMDFCKCKSPENNSPESAHDFNDPEFFREFSGKNARMFIMNIRNIHLQFLQIRDAWTIPNVVR